MRFLTSAGSREICREPATKTLGGGMAHFVRVIARARISEAPIVLSTSATRLIVLPVSHRSSTIKICLPSTESVPGWADVFFPHRHRDRHANQNGDHGGPTHNEHDRRLGRRWLDGRGRVGDGRVRHAHRRQRDDAARHALFEDVLQPSKSDTRAIGQVAPASSHAATSSSVLMH